MSEIRTNWPVLSAIPNPGSFQDVKDLDKESCPQPGVYLLLDEEDTIVYVGQSSNVRNRIKQHRSAKKLKKDFAKAVYTPVWKAADRLQIEGILILACLPRYNRTMHLGITAAGRLYDLTTATYSRKA